MKFDQKVKFKNVSVQETIGDECDRMSGIKTNRWRIGATLKQQSVSVCRAYVLAKRMRVLITASGD